MVFFSGTRAFGFNSLAVALCLAGHWLAAAESPRNGQLALTLDGGIVVVDKAGQSRSQRIELDFTVRDGKWDDKVWGTTMFFEPRYAFREAYNKTEVEGRLASFEEKAGGLRASVQAKIPRDIWGTGGVAAEYGKS